MKRVERIKDLNVRGFCAQGIVSADAITPTCIASYREEGSRRTRHNGFTPDRTSSCPFQCSRSYSGPKSAMVSNDCSAPGNSSLPAPSRISPTGAGSSLSWSRCARKSGSSTPKRRSAAPITYCITSPGIPIGWPFSNHRLIAFDGESVTFRWKDYAHGNKKRKMTISADEFLRRFLLHTLPRGFVRIRFFGFMAGPRRSRMLQLARGLLETGVECGVSPATPTPTAFRCPVCATPMIVVERLTAAMVRRAADAHRDDFNNSS
jgi:hypothetical protein